jgi:acetyl esterase/lipase
MRRVFAIVAFECLFFGLAGQAQMQSCAPVVPSNNFLGIQTVRLWPGDAPQAKGKACEDIPTLTIFDPADGSANGSAVVVFPGGGYSNLAAIHEGRQVADWFTARGFRAFVLSYRLSFRFPCSMRGGRFRPSGPGRSTITSIPIELS